MSLDSVHYYIEESVYAAAKSVEHGAETGHAEEQAGELPNIITLLYHAYPDSEFVHFLHHYENPIFAIFIAILIVILAYYATRNRNVIPHKLQNAAEWIVETLDNLICSIIGPNGRKYTPFLGTLFIYILLMNWFGLIPFMKAPTSAPDTTFGLAICVFFYVQWNGIKENGILGYLHHMAGSPNDVVGWAMSILMFPLHILEELIKPVSLALRLFGNILGEDLLIAAFVGLGLLTLSFMNSPIGLPLHFPLLLLGMLLSTVQALVFTLLSTIYIFLMLPHEEHGH